MVGQSAFVADEKPLTKEQSAIVEKAIRKSLKKPTGELTKADLEKVTRLGLVSTQITDAGLKELAKLKQLTVLHLAETQVTDAGLNDVAKMKQLKLLTLGRTKVTDAGVAQLKKALPKCDIYSKPTP